MNSQSWETQLRGELSHDYENRNDYDGGFMLSLYWKDADDEGYKDESDKVVQFFASMNFGTAIFPIPSENSHIELLSRIIHLVKDYGTPGHLVVVHYGGHGDADNDRGMDREMQAVWAAQLEGGPTVDWYEIQPVLHKCKADVLLLLDCCFSAQAARGRVREDPGKCELLAACAMRLTTPGPGPASFTTALLTEMSEMLETGDKIVTSQLLQRLIHRRANLRQTPVYVDMSLGHEGRCIRLKPFGGSRQISTHASEISTQLQLRVGLSVSPDSQDNSIHDLVRWLKIDAPSFVREIALDELVLQTEKLRQIARGQDISINTPPLVEALDTPGRQEVLHVWQQVDSLLAEASQRWIPKDQPSTLEEVSLLKERVLQFVQDLEARDLAVIKQIEDQLVKLPNDKFEEIVHSTSVKALNFDTPLQLARLVRGPQTTSNALEIGANEIQSITGDGAPPFQGKSRIIEGKLGETNVLVEYKPYPDLIGQAVNVRDRVKMQKLAEILAYDKSADFLSLRCLHWFHDSYERRYGLAFEIPSGLALPCATLSYLFGPHHRRARPTLGRRFRMAHEIGLAIQKWHLAGWVHEDIRCSNILVFQNVKTKAWDFSRPFLGGFQYSRRDIDISNGLQVEDFERNVYRHPSRQNVPLQRHDASHDIYAYGVILLEIGLWQTVLEHRYFQEAVKGEMYPKPEENQERLMKIAQQSLGHYMGADYQKAVLTCLRGDFDNLWGENRGQLGLDRLYKSQILDKVACGLSLN